MTEHGERGVQKMAWEDVMKQLRFNPPAKNEVEQVFDYERLVAPVQRRVWHRRRSSIERRSQKWNKSILTAL